jgi:hypothetical protein
MYPAATCINNDRWTTEHLQKQYHARQVAKGQLAGDCMHGLQHAQVVAPPGCVLARGIYG